jgi:tryptophanyl-tRNA synthetase
VAEVVIDMLRPIQARYRELMDDTAELDRLLAHGAAQAASVSQPKVDEMKRIMGLVVPG